MLSKVVTDAPVAPVGRPPQRSSTFWGRFMGIVHGDKHMVGAYPPEWQPRAPAVAGGTVVAPEQAIDASVAPARPQPGSAD
jgi:hypothetical protein